MAIEQEKPLGRDYWHTPDVERLIGDDQAVRYMLRAVNLSAIKSANNVRALTNGTEGVSISKEEKNRRTEILDPDSTSAFNQALDQAPIKFFGLDSEGEKESLPEKLGKPMPSTNGLHGKGSEVEADFVADTLEQTGESTIGNPNAMSIIGMSEPGGITKIPMLSDGKAAYYVRTLFAPRMFQDDVSIERPIQENLERIAKLAQIKPGDIRVVAMKRNCNATLVEQAEKFGANLEIISSGNLAWCLRAIQSDPTHPIVVVGRGGAEEGAIAMVATKAMLGTGQLRLVEERNDIEVEDKGKIWTADEYVPGHMSKATVIFSAVTRNDHFGLSPVRQSGNNPNRYFVDSMLISAQYGFRKIKNTMIEVAS